MKLVFLCINQCRWKWFPLEKSLREATEKKQENRGAQIEAVYLFVNGRLHDQSSRDPVAKLLHESEFVFHRNVIESLVLVSEGF